MLSASPEQMRLGFEDEQAWNDAVRRMQIIEPLVDRARTTADVRERAVLAGCHLTTVYAWLRRYEAERTLTALLPGRSDGGRGKSRLPSDGERILVESIDAHFEAGRPTSIRVLCEKIRARCVAENVSAPHPNTIRARVSARTRIAAGDAVRPRASKRPATAQTAATERIAAPMPGPAQLTSLDRLKRFFVPRATSV